MLERMHSMAARAGTRIQTRGHAPNLCRTKLQWREAAEAARLAYQPEGRLSKTSIRLIIKGVGNKQQSAACPYIAHRLGPPSARFRRRPSDSSVRGMDEAISRRPGHGHAQQTCKQGVQVVQLALPPSLQRRGPRIPGGRIYAHPMCGLRALQYCTTARPLPERSSHFLKNTRERIVHALPVIYYSSYAAAPPPAAPMNRRLLRVMQNASFDEPTPGTCRGFGFASEWHVCEPLGRRVAHVHDRDACSSHGHER